MGVVEVEIAQLQFDLENPRIGGAKSQRDALQKIIDDQQEKLVVLAENIVEEGMNPMDRFLVFRGSKDSDTFIVYEGNRRLAALRILANRTVLADLDIKESLRRRLDKLAQNFERSSVEPLSCFEVESRIAANKWIHLRHTGENGGKGIVSWSGIASSRFRGQDPALQALEFVRIYGGLTDEQREKLADRFPITTLNRLLSSREVRQRLGFDVQDGKLVSGLPPEELMKPLEKIVVDIAEKRVNVSGLKNKDQQVKYVEEFGPASRPDLKTVGVVRPIEGIGISDFKPKESAKPRKKRPSDPSARRSLIPRGVKMAVTDNRSSIIFEELRKLKVDATPNAVAVLFRVFLELSVDHYMEQNRIPLKFKDGKSGKSFDKSLKAKVTEVVDHLSANGGNKKDYASILRALSVEESPLHIDLLNAYVHNRFATPSTKDLVAAWNNAQRFFEGLWP